MLYAFTGGKDGAGPLSSLIFDRDGNLYGTTWYGANPACSQGGCGAVFKLMPSADGSWKAKGLHDFTNAKDGAHPVAGLIFDRAGNLYGTTLRGGDLNYGVVFKLARNSKGGWNETVLHTFTDQVGASPFATLIFDASGNLYGTTYGDNLNIFGSVFEITP